MAGSNCAAINEEYSSSFLVLHTDEMNLGTLKKTIIFRKVLALGAEDEYFFNLSVVKRYTKMIINLNMSMRTSDISGYQG